MSPFTHYVTIWNGCISNRLWHVTGFNIMLALLVITVQDKVAVETEVIWGTVFLLGAKRVTAGALRLCLMTSSPCQTHRMENKTLDLKPSSAVTHVLSLFFRAQGLSRLVLQVTRSPNTASLTSKWALTLSCSSHMTRVFSSTEYSFFSWSNNALIIKLNEWTATQT